MSDGPEKTLDTENLKCPECRATLKKRRTRNPDACEMVCGGCGQMFDVCDIDTATALKKRSGK